MNGTVQNILVAAGRLFSEFGLAATTVRQIADGARISLGGLYHHFASKEAIASELVLRFVSQLESEYTRLTMQEEEPARERIAELVRVSLRVAAAHPWATETYLREAPNLAILPDHALIETSVLRNEALWRQLALAGMARGEFRSDIEAETFTRLLSETVWLTVRLYRPRLAEQYEVLADEVVKLLLDGYRSPQVRRSTAEMPVRRQQEDLSGGS